MPRSRGWLRVVSVRSALPSFQVLLDLGLLVEQVEVGAGAAGDDLGLEGPGSLFQYLTPPERVGEERRRAAVDKVTAMQFDRHGNRTWRQARALLDDEHARYAVGSVAVPYGTCTEPSNVAAGGNDCPLRFRCAGCDISAPTSPTCQT